MKSLPAALAVLLVAGSAYAEPRYKVRWMLSHTPDEFFTEAAQGFAERIARETGGAVQVEVLHPQPGADGRLPEPKDVIASVARGDVEMSQVYTTAMGFSEEKLWVLDLPYLFRSHEHAAKVLDGPVGRRLLASTAPLNLRGLAFTYSGGYRMVPTTGRELRRPEDLKGLRIRTSPSPVAKAIFEAMGAEPVPAPLEDIAELIRSGRADGSETTFPRFWEDKEYDVAPVLNDTRHSLFLTEVVANDKFLRSLPPRYRTAVEDAARDMARAERAKSVAAGEKVAAEARQRGMKIVELTPQERKAFEVATASVYDRFSSRLGADLIRQIREAK